MGFCQACGKSTEGDFLYCSACTSRMGSALNGGAGFGTSSDKPKAIQLYEKVKSEIEGLKDSIDTSEAEVLLKKVKLAIDIKDLSSAEENARLCIKKTHGLKKIYENAAESLKESWPKVKAAKEEGRDVERSNELIKEARKALRSKQPQKSQQLSNLAVDLLLTPTERLKKKCDDVREVAKATLEAVTAFGDIKGVGLLLVHEAESFIAKGDAAYMKASFDDASQLYKKSEKSLTQLKEQYLYKQASNIYSQVANMLQDLEKKGKTVPGTSMALLKAKDALEFENFDEVIFYSIQIKNLIDEWEEQKSDDSAIQVVSQAQFLMADLRKTGEDITDIETKFDNAKSLLERGEFAPAEELAEEVIQKAQAIMDSIRDRKARLLVHKVREELENLERTDIDVSTFETDLGLAERSLGQNKYDDSIQLLKKLLVRIEKSRKDAIAPQMEKAISNAVQKVKEARDEGVDVLECEDWLRRAKFAMETRSYMEVKNLTEKIITTLVKSKDGETRKPVEYKKLIPEAMKAVQKLKEQNWDVTSLIINLKKAPVLLKGKKYDELDKLTRSVKEEAITTLKNEVILPAKEELDRATTAMKEAKEEGIDVKAVMKDITTAMKLFTGKKYYLIKEKVAPIFAYLEDVRGGLSHQQTEMVFEDLKKMIKAHKCWKIPMTKFKTEIKAGDVAQKKGNVKELAKVTRKIDAKLDELKGVYLKKQVNVVLSRVKKLVDTSKVKDKDAVLLSHRKSSDKLDEGLYVESWEDAISACSEAGVKEADCNKLRCSMVNTLVEPRMALLKIYCVDMESLQGKYGEYKNLFKKGKDFAGALDIISEIAQEAHSLEITYHMEGVTVPLAGIVGDYLSKGIDVKDIEKLVEKSTSSMEDNKYVDALKFMDEAAEKARGLMEGAFTSHEVDETECPNCNYSVLLMDTEGSPEVDCPVCATSFEVPPEN